MNPSIYCTNVKLFLGKNMLHGLIAISQQKLLHLYKILGIVLNIQEILYPRLDKNRRYKNIKCLGLGTQNIGMLISKIWEIIDTIIKRRITILCLQEIK